MKYLRPGMACGFCAAGLLVMAAVASAQTNSQDRSRMVFPPGAKEPLVSGGEDSSDTGEATPSNIPQPEESTGAAPTPEQSIDLFFLALQADNIEGAYDNLVRDTIIADRREDIRGLKRRTLEALDSYGPVTGYEVIESRTVGGHLSRKTCLSLNTDLPLRWRFYFYRSGGTWRLVDLRVDDGLVELFEDAVRNP